MHVLHLDSMIPKYLCITDLHSICSSSIQLSWFLNQISKIVQGGLGSWCVEMVFDLTDWSLIWKINSNFQADLQVKTPECEIS